MSFLRSIPRLARLLALLASIGSASVHAQASYPERPVRLVEAFSGGLSTMVAHTISDRVAPALGQPLVVNSLPGAGGNIGLRAAATAKPDGYTLIVGGQWLTTNWALKPTEWNDPTQLTPIAPVLAVPYVVITSPGKGFKTLAQLMAAAGRKEQGLSYGSPGAGTAVHLYVEDLARVAGVRLLHVAYKGGGVQLNAVLSGEVDFGVMSLTSALPLITAGKLTALAVTSQERIAVAAQIPTIAEAGFPGRETTTWFAVFGPAGLPQDIVRKLNHEVLRFFDSPEGLALIESRGAAPLKERSPAELQQLTQAEAQRWRKVVGALGMTEN